MYIESLDWAVQVCKIHVFIADVEFFFSIFDKTDTDLTVLKICRISKIFQKIVIFFTGIFKIMPHP